MPCPKPSTILCLLLPAAPPQFQISANSNSTSLGGAGRPTGEAVTVRHALLPFPMLTCLHHHLPTWEVPVCHAGCLEFLPPLFYRTVNMISTCCLLFQGEAFPATPGCTWGSACHLHRLTTCHCYFFWLFCTPPPKRGGTSYHHHRQNRGLPTCLPPDRAWAWESRPPPGASQVRLFLERQAAPGCACAVGGGNTT